MTLVHQLYLQRLREIANAPEDRFDAYRNPLIARLIDHSWRETVYYRRVLASLVERGRFDIESWHQIPLLRAGEIAGNLEALTAVNLKKPVEATEPSSGDELAPVKRLSQLSRVAADCEKELALERLGVELASTLAIVTNCPADDAQQGTGWSITFDRSDWVAFDRQLDPEVLSGRILDSGAATLQSDTATIFELARFGPIPGLTTIILADRSTTEDLARKVAEIFGVKAIRVLEWPATGMVACASTAETRCHIPAASNIVEVVGDDGSPTPMGETGELVITPLYEYSTPLLRLATGVQARAAEQVETHLGTRQIAEWTPPGTS